MQYQKLDGIQKGSNSFDHTWDRTGPGIFKHLKEDEIEQLTLEIANTRSVSPADERSGFERVL